MAWGLLAFSASAQILKGDMNDDGELDVIDINASSATILGQQEKQYINPGVNPFAIDNSLVAGIWWLNKTDHFSLMTDGKTDYNGAATYEFLPYQGRIRFMNNNGKTVSWMSVIKLTNGNMWVAPNGQNSLVAYTSTRPEANLSDDTPFTVDNSLVAGIWWHNVNTHFSLADDGKTDYDGAATYEFYPYQGRIVFMNASGVPVSWMSVAKLVEGRMWVAPNGQSSLVAYSIKRPDAKLVTSIQLSATNLELDINENKQLTATVLPDDADNKTITWTSSNESVAKVTNGNIHAVAVGTATITCSATDGSGVKATCEVRVVKKDHSGKDDNCEWVDLDLPGGVMWAAWNVGANNPLEGGRYFAWGETTGYYQRNHDFCFSNYKYNDDGEYNKYNKDDRKEVLEASDDAATAAWGSAWRMPTRQELNDLREHCTWTWTTNYKGSDINGYIIRSKSNGNFIFLSAAGYCSEEDFYNENYVDYWTSSLNNEDDPYLAYFAYGTRLSCTHESIAVNRIERWRGLPIRAVRK